MTPHEQRELTEATGTFWLPILASALLLGWLLWACRVEPLPVPKADAGPQEVIRSVDGRVKGYRPALGSNWAVFYDSLEADPLLSIPATADGGFDSVCFPGDGGERCVPMRELAERCQ